jgi:DNA (cytosine-5)-methyltransferase 1
VRAFIVGRRGGLRDFQWPGGADHQPTSISTVLDPEPSNAKRLSPSFIEYLQVWQAFLDRFPTDEPLPSFPIWAMEFGATYPFEDKSPAGTSLSELRKTRGAFGLPLRRVPARDVRLCLPRYAQGTERHFPKWKVDFIRLNRQLYSRHRSWIDEWLPSIRGFDPSFQKLEWNCQGERRDIWRYIIQFRASGIRIKRPSTAPSLVASSTSQVPVIAWERRYMTIRECSRLQSMDDLRYLPESDSAAFRALGNAVNVEVVSAIAQGLLTCGSPTCPSPTQSSQVDDRCRVPSRKLSQPAA